jgi:spermidine synthase
MRSFTERLHLGMRASYAVKGRLLKQRTAYQRLEVYETLGFGRMLVLDDVVEATERDEFIYHEMMVHVPMYTHPNPKRVLIIGGGDGGALREVLRHPTVERAVLVEIDGAVIGASKRFLRKICRRAFKDPRAEVIVGDGAAYVRETGETFDVVIVDSTDPLGPSMPLFGRTFYRNAVRILRPKGLLVRQTGSAMLQSAELISAVRNARKVFPCVRVFLSSVPTYVGGLFTHPMMSAADFSARITLPAVRRRAARHPLAMHYYSPEVHAAAFVLPEYVRRLVARA